MACGQQIGQDDGPGSLRDLIEALRPQADDARVYVHEALDRVGTQSFPAVILIPAVLLVSPLSGIPGTPTLGACLIFLCALQAVLGRKHLWLPGWLTRRSVSAKRMTKALNWLGKPAAWMDRYSKDRLCFLTARPTRPLAYLFVLLTVIGWPILELVPFFTSFSAGAVAMVMFGVMTRDGAYLLWGYVQGALLYLAVLAVATGIV
ncbi:exopolysaccharide biosynthesis protein [Tropicibacter naphthalenivorans]|uniref:Exopolysaccharide synthesis, ExoD n=1 Tax=Tropicibacter naphthalenivorans TaxID=441103 RepID=A0A0P1G9I3_9RHOB|nr:exopolysaccharide biosynthesis protein [Tropicibacter naphthalenivorans]CUH78048.1 Exopolysaccharide synthesis, ExoD [Tropicibacter naphthalenivorans]SMC94012.1 Uncharacterized conserved protein [Tropicibacter naphthalenivorans]